MRRQLEFQVGEVWERRWYRVSFELVRRETLLWVIRLDETNGPSVL